jgi:Na+(H+)/acetate symporter ActP
VKQIGGWAGLFHSLVLEICQEDNLTQRRKDAKKNQVFRTEDAKIFGLNCGFALAILTLLGNESALGGWGDWENN